MSDMLNKTRLVEEVPGVASEEAFFLWSGAERRTVWTGPSVEAGQEWAAKHDIIIDQIEWFEP